MNYIDESKLINSFLQSYKAFFSKVTGRRVSRCFLLKEFDSWFGVADVVVGSFVPYLSVRSLRSGIDKNWVEPLVYTTQKSSITVSELSKQFRVSTQTAKKYLNQYVNAGFLRKTDTYTYSRLKDYRVVVETTIAIEAKIKNWQQALHQARRYMRFSNYTFVLLDEKYISAAEKNIKIFKEFNVGLASMKGKRATIHFLPSESKSVLNSYMYRLNEVAFGYFKNVYGGCEELDSKR